MLHHVGSTTRPQHRDGSQPGDTIIDGRLDRPPVMSFYCELTQGQTHSDVGSVVRAPVAASLASLRKA